MADYHLPFHITGDQVITEIATRLGFKPLTIMLASVPSPSVEKVMSVAEISAPFASLAALTGDFEPRRQSMA
jgi:hypothetical protein